MESMLAVGAVGAGQRLFMYACMTFEVLSFEGAMFFLISE